MKTQTSDSVLALLRYSWEDINFDYNKLSSAEKACIEKVEFDALVAEMKSKGMLRGLD